MKKNIVLLLLFSFCLVVKSGGVHEIIFDNYKKIDMKENFLRGTFSIIPIDNKFYLLDKKQRKIFMFNKNGFIKSFGGAGQAPGKLSRPISLFNMDDNLCCLEALTGKLVVYDKNGIFLKSFKIKIKGDDSNFISDAIFYNNQIIVVFSLGKEFLRIYDKNGNYVKSIFKKKEIYSHITHSYDISLINNKLCVVSLFDGSYFLVDLAKNTVIKNCVPKVDKQLDFTRKDAEKQFENPRKRTGDFISITQFFPVFTTDSGKFYSLYREPFVGKKGKILKLLCIDNESYKVIDLVLIKGENVHLKDISYCNGYVVLIGTEGDVFINKEEF